MMSPKPPKEDPAVKRARERDARLAENERLRSIQEQLQDETLTRLRRVSGSLGLSGARPLSIFGR
ncbi:MAG: hypothetical protein HXY25_06985 [Alphaproteobacteria bacterium]|nr:hypothetical protein [Alphaproteobacteria bacterium]